MLIFKEFFLQFLQQVENRTRVAVWVLVCFDIIGITKSSIKQFLCLAVLSVVAHILSMTFRNPSQDI